MYPAVSKVNLHTVDCRNPLVGVLLFDTFEQCVHVHVGREVDAVLGDAVVGVGASQFADLHAAVCQMAEEECYTNECVATIVAGWVDNAAVAFAADHGIVLAHECGDVHFAYSRSLVGAAVATGDISQCACGGEVADRVTGCVLEHIVGNADQRIFLAEHVAVLADDSQTVNIRVNYKSYIRLATTQQVANLGEMLRQRFGVMREVSVRCAVEADNILHAECLQHSRNSQSANGVDAIDSHGEVSLAYRLGVHKFQVQYVLHVVGQIILVLDSAEFADLGESEVFALGDGEYLFALLVREKLSALVKQFERVPLHRVVAGGEDNTSGSLLTDDSQFSGRRGGETDVHHAVAHTAECGCNEHVNHLTTNACVTTYDECAVVGQSLTALGGVCCTETNDIYGIESLAYAAAYRTAYAGNAFD